MNFKQLKKTGNSVYEKYANDYSTGNKNIDASAVYEVPVQTEIPTVISVPRAEMCSNALLFYDAFRGLCRMRIKYAQFMSEGFEQMNINETITEEWVSKKMEFWAKVKAYWERKLRND